MFIIEDKKINKKYVSNKYVRSFPILSINTETPFKFKNNYKNLIFYIMTTIYVLKLQEKKLNLFKDLIYTINAPIAQLGRAFCC